MAKTGSKKSKKEIEDETPELYVGKNINAQGQLVVYSYKKDTGEYLGEGTASESPLEPGTFHIPANATEIKPMDFKDGYGRFYKEGEWQLVKDPTIIEAVITDEQKALLIRNNRNIMLQQCDFTQLPDSSFDAKLWAKYRQALRDVTKQKGFPNSVEWPEVPKN
jgi:hypothetical protein